MATAIPNHGSKVNFGDLDASGNTTDYYQVPNHARHTIQYTIADISNNIVVRVEGSIDPTYTNWFNLSAGNTDTTHTANGTYAFTSTAHVEYIRLNFVSRSSALVGSITDIYYSGSLL